MEVSHRIFIHEYSDIFGSIGAIQGAQSSFNDNGESNLDLQYAMSLVGKSQPVTLYQAGDFVEGLFILLHQIGSSENRCLKRCILQQSFGCVGRIFLYLRGRG